MGIFNCTTMTATALHTRRGAFTLVDLRWDDPDADATLSVGQRGTSAAAKELMVSLVGGEAKRIVPGAAGLTVQL